VIRFVEFEEDIDINLDDLKYFAAMGLRLGIDRISSICTAYLSNISVLNAVHLWEAAEFACVDSLAIQQFVLVNYIQVRYCFAL